MSLKFYKCNVCGQVVQITSHGGNPLTCCDKTMKEIIPSRHDELNDEKHVPIIKVKRNRVYVKVGSVPHPSTSEHYIEWITLVTNKGVHTKHLKPGDEPKACFILDCHERMSEVYAYCNIHSLWINTLDEEMPY